MYVHDKTTTRNYKTILDLDIADGEYSKLRFNLELRMVTSLCSDIVFSSGVMGNASRGIEEIVKSSLSNLIPSDPVAIANISIKAYDTIKSNSKNKLWDFIIKNLPIKGTIDIVKTYNYYFNYEDGITENYEFIDYEK